MILRLIAGVAPFQSNFPGWSFPLGYVFQRVEQHGSRLIDFDSLGAALPRIRPGCQQRPILRPCEALHLANSAKDAAPVLPSVWIRFDGQKGN